jgi:diaminopimelate decarboxylase
MTHFGPTRLDAALIPKIARQWGTPIYLHDQAYIENSCEQLLSMPNPYGLHVRYAMKANSDRTVLRVVTSKGWIWTARHSTKLPAPMPPAYLTAG